VSTFSSNTTILADVATEFDVNAVETKVVEPPGAGIHPDPVIKTNPSKPAP